MAQKNLPNSTYIGEINPSGDLMRSLLWTHRSFQSTPHRAIALSSNVFLRVGD
ncbi:hypothetical protein [Coleofasciculus sp. H7-2]|uniref:hypothetical protein n=1 Tax=Coleofasciculus sp. H7-2 TaxID=3351545 RepID=UPI0036701EA3